MYGCRSLPELGPFLHVSELHVVNPKMHKMPKVHNMHVNGPQDAPNMHNMHDGGT